MNFEQPNSDYLNAYEQMVNNAPSALSAEVFDALSIPHLLSLTVEYRKAPVRVLVFGQETYGVETRLADMDTHSEDWLQRAVKHAQDETAKFNFAVGSSVENSPFWTGYQEIVELFGLSGRQAVGWSNIVKVQTVATGSEATRSISKFGAEEKGQVIQWQRDLLRAEIAYARPHLIVMFTGGLTWLARETFRTKPWNAQDCDLKMVPFDGLNENSGQMTAPLFGDAITVYTYHPAALRTAEEKAMVRNHRHKVLTRAKELMKTRAS